MRLVFVGATQLSILTAEILISRGHEVVIIDSERNRIEELSDTLDCGFLHGDGSRPNILREAAPEQTDVLFCLTDNDQVNVLAALIGRSLGFAKVVPSIRDPELMSICRELGLDHTIIPDQTIGRYLADMAVGVDILELSTLVKGEARFFSFVAGKGEARAVSELDLPVDARAIFLYRQNEFRLIEDDTEIRPDDEVVILTHSRNLPELRKRWQPEQAMEEGG